MPAVEHRKSFGGKTRKGCQPAAEACGESCAKSRVGDVSAGEPSVQQAYQQAAGQVDRQGSYGKGSLGAGLYPAG